MKLYQVIVYTQEKVADGWLRHGSLPTFYLRDDMQGITDALHAERIARGMLETIAPATEFNLHIAVSAEFDPAVIGA